MYGKSVHNKNDKSKNTSDPQIPQPDLRFAANPTAKHTRNGAGPNKTPTQMDCHADTVTCQQYRNQKHATELPCITKKPALHQYGERWKL